MKLYHDAESAFVTVELEPRDIRSFADSWPCFHGPDRVRFTFERSSGDLVDMEPIEFGGAAAVAMSEDAWRYFDDHAEPDPPETFRTWFLEALDREQLRELAALGADAGFSGLTYTADCVELYERHEDEIREALREDAETFGYDSPEAFVATFHRSDMLWSAEGRKTLLVWYLAERIAREVSEAEPARVEGGPR